MDPNARTGRNQAGFFFFRLLATASDFLGDDAFGANGALVDLCEVDGCLTLACTEVAGAGVAGAVVAGA
jgi:hypothetical protein